MNVYRYVGNNPVNWVDPLGLWQLSISFGYGYGGYLTFGNNSGRNNFGIGVGYGLGFKVEGTVADLDREYTDCGLSTQIGVEISADGKLGGIGGTANMSIQGRYDFANNHQTNIKTGIGISSAFQRSDRGGNLNIGAVTEAGIRGNTTTNKLEIYGSIKSISPSFGFGGMVFGGTSFGFSW